MSRWSSLRGKLRGGFFVSSMGGVTDGAFCASRGRGCIMVQLGAYLAEPPAYGLGIHRLPVLPPDRDGCVDFLRSECSKVRSLLGDVYVCLNLATPKLEWGLEATEYFYEAGGDIVELNFHGTYEPYYRIGKLRAMVLPENRSELFRWLEAFANIDKPVIAKFRARVIPDYSPIMDYIEDLDLVGVHFNIRGVDGKPDYSFLEELKRRYPGEFILVSGYIWSVEAARKTFQLGADMIGIAEPTREDSGFIEKIVSEMK
ncbi:MAG: hypothetical protein QXQ29_01780 [Candidatus Bathyarchaeia archaeon]